MPDASNQVYWHNIPGAPSPWRSSDELQRAKQLSDQVRSSRTVVYDKESNIEMQRSARALKAAKMYARIRRKNQSSLYDGVVPEPYMTPLLAFNVLMEEEFRARPVTVDEAAAAVQSVTEYYMALTQPARESASTRQSRRGLNAKESLLASLTASQINLTQQSTGPTITADIQDALILDVLASLCPPRGLKLSRVTDRDMRKMRKTLGTADTIPGQRAIIIADRSEPMLAVVYGVVDTSRSSQSEASEGNNKTTGSQAQALHMLVCGNRPIPWRRILPVTVPRLSVKECSFAFIERDLPSDDEDDDEESILGGDSSSSAGHTTTTMKEEAVLKEGHSHAPPAPGVITPPRSPRVGDIPVEIRKQYGLHLANEGQQEPLCCQGTTFFATDGRTASDPLMNIPRVPGKTQMTRKTWIERLLPHSSKGGANVALAKLHAVGSYM